MLFKNSVQSLLKEVEYAKRGYNNRTAKNRNTIS